MTHVIAMTALARTTLAEAIRDRILYGLLLFALGLILFSAVLSSLTLGYQVRIVTDISLSAVSLSGSVMALLLGVGSVAREVERRTAYSILAKPLPRASFVVGKYLGVVLTVWLNAGLMALASTAMIAVFTWGSATFQYPLGDYLLTLGLLAVKLALVAALAVSFSTFTSSTVALIASGGLVIAGGLTGELRFFLGQSEDAAARALGDVLYYALPDLAALEGLPRLLHGLPVAGGGALAAAAYGVAYGAAVLTLSSWLFSRRDLP